MRYLVTGSHGFIGSNLVRRLRNRGDEVVCVDVKINYPIHEAFEDDLVLDEIDFVYHLACMNQMSAVLHPFGNILANAEGTRIVAEFCGKNNIPMIYTSTASVYGQATQIPTPVEAQMRPRTDYAITKLAGEYFVKNHAKSYVILRLSNVYGPGQTSENPYCGVVGKFIEAALDDKPLNVFGTGSQTRDFTYVDDVLDCLLDERLMLGKTLNVSRGIETSVLELASAVSEGTGRKLKLNYLTERPIDGIHSRVLKSDYPCNTDLSEGIEKTVEWFRESSRKTSTGRAAQNRSTAISR